MSSLEEYVAANPPKRTTWVATTLPPETIEEIRGAWGRIPTPTILKWLQETGYKDATAARLRTHFDHE